MPPIKATGVGAGECHKRSFRNQDQAAVIECLLWVRVGSLGHVRRESGLPLTPDVSRHGSKLPDRARRRHPSTRPRRIGRGSFLPSLRGYAAASAFRFRRHKPSRPPPAMIRPGRPAPAMGPGTALDSEMKLKSPKPTVATSLPVITFTPALRRNVAELKLEFPRAALISPAPLELPFGAEVKPLPGDTCPGF